MYSETDLEGAVAAGILPRETADAFRAHVAAERSAPMVDEESFRLLTGFNDIFVSIALILSLVALGWIGGSVGGGSIAGLAVAAGSWGLAEYFTRQRRMALPSILLLSSFCGGVFFTFSPILIHHGYGDPDPKQALAMAIIAAITTGAAWAHWRRFKVPITIAAGTGAMACLILSLVLAAIPQAIHAFNWLLLIAGLAIFAFAMHWDSSDLTRTTRRSDVAFWLHLSAAPMIAHSIFWTIGVFGGELGIEKALIVLTLYILFGLVALAVDRRALLVSSLVYVLYALYALFHKAGAVKLSAALTGLFIGSALLLLSAFWHGARSQVVKRLSPALQRRLPSISRIIPRPAA